MTHTQMGGAAVLALIAILVLTGCATSGIGVTLSAITIAAEAATITVPALELAGIIPSVIGNVILEYAATVSTAAKAAAIELASSDAQQVKAANVVTILTSALKTAPAGLPQEVESVALAITHAVEQFVMQFKTPAMKLQLAPGQKEYRLTFADRRALSSLQKKADAIAMKARSLKK